MIKINILVLWANPLSPNKGVAALSYAFLSILAKIEILKGMSFSYYSNAIDKEIAIKIENSTIIMLPLYIPINKLSTIRLFSSLKNMQTLLKINYVFDLGEGDSYSDIYGNKRFHDFNNVKNILLRLRKPIYLMPQTIGPIDNFHLLSEFKKTCTSKFISISTRDTCSTEFIKNNLPRKDVFQTIDMAFFLPYEITSSSDNLTRVGLNVSALLWNGGYTRNNQFKLNVNYQKIVEDLIKYFTGVTGCELFLVPHVLHGNSDIENDYEVSLMLRNKYPNVKLPDFFLDPIQAKSFISSCHFFVGARMHSCIAAFSSGVPVVPMAYSRKFNGLFSDTLGYDYLVDMKNIEYEDALLKIQRWFISRGELKKSVMRINEKMIENERVRLTNIITEFICRKQ